MRAPPTWPALLSYALLALLLALSWWRGVTPFAFLSGDGGNIAGFAAAWAHPEAFANDPVLSDPNNFQFYATVHIAWLMVGERIFGTIGNAFLLLLPITMFVQAMGYRQLGQVLSEDEAAAFLLGLMSFGSVPLNIDNFGTYTDALPRSLFQAAFPYLLAGAVQTLRQPKAWPRLFAFHGLATYLHPVSAPSVALASWLALAVGGKERRLLALLLAGTAFLALSAPFAVNYLIGHQHGHVENLAEVRALQRWLYGAPFSDGWIYAEAVTGAWQVRWLLPLASGIGAILVWLFAPDRRFVLGFLAAWTAAAVLASLGVTLTEQEVARRLEVVPVEIDTIRNLAYVVPVLMVVAFWGVAAAARRLPRRTAVTVMAVAALGWLVANKPGVLPARDTLACLASGKLLCPPPHWADQIAVLEHLRLAVPRGTLVLPAVDRYTRTELGQAVRYHAGLPLSFCYKDGGILGYSKVDRLRQWRWFEHRFQEAHGRGELKRILDMADESHSDMVLTDLPVAPADLHGWQVRHRAGPYSVLERSPTTATMGVAKGPDGFVQGRAALSMPAQPAPSQG
jgi:hypothetical protein